MKNILLIVDPQNDFISGTLPVEGAEAKMKKLAEYIKAKNTKYDYIFITMDSHPTNHSSFKNNGGIWPEHCVKYTKGWELPGYLNEAINTASNCFVEIYYKGNIIDSEEYSIFDNYEDGVILTRQIMSICEEGEVYFDVCGIAGDYCVLETLKGLTGLVGTNYISVLDEFTASIDRGEKLHAFVTENNINIITDSTLNLEEICTSNQF